MKSKDFKTQSVYLSILAYWNVFLDRFCDKLYMSISYNFLFKLQKDLSIILDMNVLEDDKGGEEILNLICETPELAQKRKLLDQNLKKCKDALKIIDSF